MTAVAAILIFCLLILSHEFGHFIVAKACGVCVNDFSLGMGPKLYAWKGKETQYTLRLLPVGGWCKMLGEDEESDNERAFCMKPVWQRICIIAAGPVMNFICAIILFIIIFMMMGAYSEQNVVGMPLPDSPAYIAGIEGGDRILAINGQTIDEWADIRTVVNEQGGQALSVEIIRDGQSMTLILEPYYDAASQAWLIGVQPQQQRQNLFVAIGLGVKQSVLFAKELILAVVGMFAGTTPVEVAGPVGIVSIIGDATSYGIRSLLLLAAYLSINLGLLNLFPLPALDGSRIVFLIIEGLRGKPIDSSKEGMVHFVGLVLLLALMAVVTFNDIVRLLA